MMMTMTMAFLHILKLSKINLKEYNIYIYINASLA